MKSGCLRTDSLTGDDQILGALGRRERKEKTCIPPFPIANAPTSDSFTTGSGEGNNKNNISDFSTADKGKNPNLYAYTIRRNIGTESL